jgi:hypothetical protein
MFDDTGGAAGWDLRNAFPNAACDLVLGHEQIIPSLCLSALTVWFDRERVFRILLEVMAKIGNRQMLVANRATWQPVKRCSCSRITFMATPEIDGRMCRSRVDGEDLCRL